MRSQNLVRFLVSLSVLALPLAASGQSPDDSGSGGPSAVAVLTIDAEPVLHDTIQTGLNAGAGSTRVLGAKAVQDRLAGRVETGCVEPDCLQKAGESLSVDWLLTAKVSRIDGITYDVILQLYSRKGQVKQVARTCEGCSIVDLGTFLSEAMTEVLKPPPKVDVEITSDPPGALLNIDGKEVGTAPYAGKLTPGTHEVRASQDGYDIGERTIDVTTNSAETQRFTVALVASVIDDINDADGSSRPFKLLKWVGAGAAVSSIGAGITWLIVNDDGTCSDQDTCPEVYDTQTLGFISLGAGALLGAATVYMFVSDWNNTTSDTMAIIAPTRDGAMANVRLRF